MMEQFTRYERARILGARALQIAMNAPLLIKISKDDLEKVKYDALKIAEIELNSNVLPISVKKPMPKRIGGQLKRVPAKQLSDEQKEKLEAEEEKDIQEGGELMELAQGEEEQEAAAEVKTPEELQ